MIIYITKEEIAKMAKSEKPITPINFNSLPNDCTLVDVTILGILGVSILTLVSTSILSDDSIESFLIIEFLNLSLDLNLFFLEFFFDTLSFI